MYHGCEMCIHMCVCVYVYICRHIERVAWKRFPWRIESGQFPYYHFILLYSLRLLLFTLPQENGHHHHTYIYHTFHTLVHNKRWSNHSSNTCYSLLFSLLKLVILSLPLFFFSFPIFYISFLLFNSVDSPTHSKSHYMHFFPHFFV